MICGSNDQNKRFLLQSSHLSGKNRILDGFDEFVLWDLFQSKQKQRRESISQRVELILSSCRANNSSVYAKSSSVALGITTTFDARYQYVYKYVIYFSIPFIR